MIKRVLIASLIGAFLLPFGGCSLTRKDKLVNEQSLSLAGVTDLSIDYASGHITLQHGTSDQLEIKEYMSLHQKGYDAEIAQSGGAVTVTAGQRPADPAFSAKISVYLPAGFGGNVRLSTSSGSIHSQEAYTFRSFAAVSQSGGIECAGISAASIRLENNSGGIDGSGLTGFMEVSSQSGSTRLYDLCGAGHFTGGSGRMEVTLETLIDSVSLSTTSGRLDVKLPGKVNAQFSAATGSGRLAVDLDGDFQRTDTSVKGTLGEAPKLEISLSTTSGRLQVGRS